MRLQLVSDRDAGIPPCPCSGETADFLLTEANHRIANNLAVIAGMIRARAGDVARQGRSLSAPEARLMLADLSSRIHVVGQLHRMLARAGEGEAVDLHDYLRDVAEAAIAAMAEPGQVRLAAERGVPCELPADLAMLVGVIVGELVTNAVKYAHPARVKGLISLGCGRSADGSILIQVADDGVGLSEGFQPERSGSMGLRMIRGLAERLGARLDFASTDAGLTVSLRIPRSAAARP